MQHLEIPQFYKDMVHSISLTGVTTLTQSRYKQRHGGSKEIVQIPRSGFKLASVVRREEKALQPKSTKKRRKVKKEVQKLQPKSTIKKYTIDKTQVVHRIKGYLNAMKGEKMLYFWTVTFPKGTTDDTAYLLLNKWFTRLRTEKMIKDYLWVAERQQNGTIHFHIVVNHRMDVKRANRFMRASIMYSIDKSEIDWTREQAKNYNGVDICKDRKTKRVTNFAKQNKEKSLSNYITKYITKNEGTFEHLAWHSSRGYSNLITSVRLTAIEFHGTNIKYLISNEDPLICEYFTHYKWKGSPPKDLLKYFSDINQQIQKLLP